MPNTLFGGTGHQDCLWMLSVDVSVRLRLQPHILLDGCRAVSLLRIQSPRDGLYSDQGSLHNYLTRDSRFFVNSYQNVSLLWMGSNLINWRGFVERTNIECTNAKCFVLEKSNLLRLSIVRGVRVIAWRKCSKSCAKGVNWSSEAFSPLGNLGRSIKNTTWPSCISWIPISKVASSHFPKSHHSLPNHMGSNLPRVWLVVNA